MLLPINSLVVPRALASSHIDERDGMALQEDWRLCGICECLVYKGFGDGVCFDGNPHQLGNSGAYGVGFDEPPPQGVQENWLWCARCQGLFFAGADERCFNDEPHDPNGSRPYWVRLDDVPPGAQDNWRWCNRCGRLIYNGFGDGICWTATSTTCRRVARTAWTCSYRPQRRCHDPPSRS